MRMKIGPGMAPRRALYAPEGLRLRGLHRRGHRRPSTGPWTRTVTATSPTTSTSSTCRSASTTAPPTTRRTPSSTTLAAHGVLPVIVAGQRRRPDRHRWVAGQRAALARGGQHRRRLPAPGRAQGRRPGRRRRASRPARCRSPTTGRQQPDVTGDVGRQLTDPAQHRTAAQPLSPADAATCRRQGRLARVGRQRRHSSLRLGRPREQRRRRRRHRRHLHLGVRRLRRRHHRQRDHPGLPAAQGGHRQAPPGSRRPARCNVTFYGSLALPITNVNPAITDTLSTLHLARHARLDRRRQARRDGSGRHHRVRGHGHRQRRPVLSGTSMATPHIAGIAALVKVQHPTGPPSRSRRR